ncbi:immunoglobulin-like domain-containing protein [Domibacillus robiginosus]|uniref:immunoglobulin-like domain-containing protein n=1 Tax=Domibacillus robiginosus TaxID=1071054 RepID=UPI00067DE004|nr:immunoglobulin-like domain-containing protein [Domibacillus robiginosus]
MNKRPFITFCFIAILLFLTGCQSDNSQAHKDLETDSDSYLTEEAAVQEVPSSENGISITTEKAQYPQSVETIIIKIQNDSNEEFMTGTQVFLEKNIEGTWYEVPMKAEFFTEEGIIHPPGESSIGLDINDLKYALTPGQYRATVERLAAPFEVVE